MSRTSDPFPSRLVRSKEPFVRTDPVVHSRNQHRWDGPLDEESLSRYERDGFLWFEGFFSQERMQPFFDELKEISKDKELDKKEQIIRDPARSQ